MKYCLQRMPPSCVAKPCRRALRRYPLKGIGFTLVFKSLSIGSRIVQFAVSKFRTDRQYIIDTKFERNIRFAAEAQVFQTALNKIQAV